MPITVANLSLLYTIKSIGFEPDGSALVVLATNLMSGSTVLEELPDTPVPIPAATVQASLAQMPAAGLTRQQDMWALIEAQLITVGGVLANGVSS